MKESGPPMPPQTPAPEREKLVSFEDVSRELAALKELGVEDPEFSDDPRAQKFQEALSDLDARMGYYEDMDARLTRTTLFVRAGYIDRTHVDEAIEFLQQDWANAQEADNRTLADQIQSIIDELEKFRVEPERELPTTEKIAQALRQPGRIPTEVHELFNEWKRAQQEVQGSTVESLIAVELAAAHLYADNGRILDAIGSITGALISNQTIKKAKSEIKQPLVDYRTQLQEMRRSQT